MSIDIYTNHIHRHVVWRGMAWCGVTWFGIVWRGACLHTFSATRPQYVKSIVHAFNLPLIQTSSKHETGRAALIEATLHRSSRCTTSIRSIAMRPFSTSKHVVEQQRQTLDRRSADEPLVRPCSTGSQSTATHDFGFCILDSLVMFALMYPQLYSFQMSCSS